LLSQPLIIAVRMTSRLLLLASIALSITAQHSSASAKQAVARQEQASPPAGHASPTKDAWDKLAAIAPFASAMVVGLLGIYATWLYNRRQLENVRQQRDRELVVQRVQTVERFFPYLTSETDATRRAALDTIAALGDELLAAKLAEHFGGTYRTEILANLAASTDPAAETAALSALASIHVRERSSIVKVHCGPRNQTITISIGVIVGSDGKIAVPFTGLTIPPFEITLGDWTPPSVITPSDWEKAAPTAALISDEVSSGIAILAITEPISTIPLRRFAEEFEPSVGSKAIVIEPHYDRGLTPYVGVIVGETRAPSGLKRWAMTLAGSYLVGAPVFDTNSVFLGVVESHINGTALVIPSWSVWNTFDSLQHRLTLV
jgi:hypothetical protein